MRLTLPVVIITIIIYELGLFAVTAWTLMGRAREMSATRQGDWLETTSLPAWWWPLAIVPPVLLIGYWSYKRR